MRVGRFCINWKVLAVLGAVGVGVFAVAPNIGRSVLPVLLLAACPLSMLFMMRAMHGDSEGKKRGVDPDVQGPSPDELDQLNARLARTQAEQHAIAREIARLQAGAVTAEAEATLERTRLDDELKGNSAR